MQKNIKATVRFKKEECFTWRGNFKYALVRDAASGRKNRYTCLIMTQPPVIFGLELPKDHAKMLMREIDAEYSNLLYEEENDEELQIATRCLQRVLKARRANSS